MPVKENELIKFGKSLTSKMLSSTALNSTPSTNATPFNSAGSQQLPNSSPSSPSNNSTTFQMIPRGLDDDLLLQTANQSEGKSAKSLDLGRDLSRLTNFGSKDFTRNAKKESLKEQKKNYRSEKKRATNELLSTLQDPTVIVLSDWLKVRGTLKSWTKLWCVLKPGLLVLYKSNKSSHWVATCLLSSCEVLERPSKKNGFCFKVFHPLDQSIWATKGPKGESIGALTLPLPTSYIIFRAPSEAAGKCWMDALELALHCSSLLMRTMTKDSKDPNSDMSVNPSATSGNIVPIPTTPPAVPGTTEVSTAASSLADSFISHMIDFSDCEDHFKCVDDEDARTDKDEESESDDDDDDKTERSRRNSEIEKLAKQENEPPVESPYTENVEEELGQLGDASQTEEVADENKSIIWSLVKQVRPGMDLSRVALPTFILEPRSFLDKLSDYYYHADLLSEAVTLEDPFSRMKMVVKWYLSGFYKKPKGLKKPYNPILGEMFRCFWKHPKTGSRTFYIAEQISHHPPVSAFYITNRQDGFAISGSILAKSKFYGNSLSAILDGVCRLVFLNRGEDYVITMPYAHCKGILIGTLTMEFGGEVSIQCEKTGYRADLEFKLKPFLGSGETSNKVVGKIKLGDETLATIEGHWDQEIFIKDKRTGTLELFWNPTPTVKSQRLKRHTISMEAQSEFESEKLWSHVSDAIVKGDQQVATDEKCFLEEEQRKSARERKAKLLEWTPNLFERNAITGDWIYKYADWRPWDPLNDVIQFERDFIISTKTHHQTPIVHTTSITSMEEKPTSGNSVHGHSRHSSMECAKRTNKMKRMKQIRSILPNSQSGDRSNVNEVSAERCDSESSLSAVEATPTSSKRQTASSIPSGEAVHSLIRIQKESSDKLASMQQQLTAMQGQLRSLSAAGSSNSSLLGSTNGRGATFDTKDLAVFMLAILLQAFFTWWFK